jgi:hypothetical protein
MTQSSVESVPSHRTFYPHMRDSYNDRATSDITLCFGENEKVYAHKVILRAASGVWNQAFNSKLLVSTQGHYDIQGHSDVVIYAMLRLVYGIPLEEEPSGIPEDDRIDYFFGVLPFRMSIRYLRLARLLPSKWLK